MKTNKTLDIIDIIVRIIVVVAAIIAAYWSIQFLLGNSPDLSQINSVLIIMLSGVLITMFKLMYNLNREVGEIKIGMKNSFNNIKEDINLIKDKLNI